MKITSILHTMLTFLIVCGCAWWAANVVKDHSVFDNVIQTACALTVGQTDCCGGGLIHAAQAFIEKTHWHLHVQMSVESFRNSALQSMPVCVDYVHLNLWEAVKLFAIWEWRQLCKHDIIPSPPFFKVLLKGHKLNENSDHRIRISVSFLVSFVFLFKITDFEGSSGN